VVLITNPMTILVRLVLNRKFVAIISRFCATLSAVMSVDRQTYLSPYMSHELFDGYCSTVQGLLDWFEVDSGFTELACIQIDLKHTSPYMNHELEIISRFFATLSAVMSVDRQTYLTIHESRTMYVHT